MLATVLATLCLATATFAKTIHVPADQPTIQAGINAAVNGDTVSVSAGTYYENINFNGKEITLTSASGPALTIIDGQQLGSVVTFSTNETTSSVISGFTIRNGNSYVSGYGGGGINLTGGASATITGNIITTNYACGDGTAIENAGGAPVIKGNFIVNNTEATYCGGGSGAVYVNGGSGAQVSGNVVAANYPGGINVVGTTAPATLQSNAVAFNFGGGIWLYSLYNNGAGANLIQNLINDNQQLGVFFDGPPVSLVNNTIANNGTGFSNYAATEVDAQTTSSQMTLENNVIVGVSTYAPALYCGSYDSTNAPVFTTNDVYGEYTPWGGPCPDPAGTSGNISTDPLFVGMLSDNFHLQKGSPAIDVGTNSATGLPSKDFDGDARTINKIVDMGVDEYRSSSTMALSTYQFQFGSVDVGSTSPAQTVTLTNNGSAAVNINLIAASSTYAQTNTCPISLAAKATCQISVTFSPVAGGNQAGVVGIFTSATVNPIVIALSGTGLAPSISFNGYFFFYGVVVGSSQSQTGTLTNNGQAPLSISSITISGMDYTETNNCPLSPSTLAVNASCTITITYSPTIASSYESATLVVNSNAVPNQFNIFAYGSSVSQGVATLTPSSLTFPTTVVGSTSSPQNFTLTNTGTGTLGSISITSFSPDFPFTTTCTGSLAVGASCTISVSFMPSIVGTETQEVLVYNDSNVWPSASLIGTGQAAAPAISSIAPLSVAAGASDTQLIINGSGFIWGITQVYYNGVSLSNVYASSSQIAVTIPAADLATPQTAQITVSNPAPGGGTAGPVTFTVYTPVNYSSQSTKYSYRNITGTDLNLSYYGSAQITSPFGVQIGGGSYTNLTVGAGGTISVDGFYSENGLQIPYLYESSVIIAPFWDALYPAYQNGASGNVFWEVTGTAPNRELVIEWRNINYCCDNLTTDTIKFQVVFDEGSSNILFNYADTVFGGSQAAHDKGATASVGVRVTSTVGTQYSYYTPSLSSKSAILWYPSVPTASLSTSTVNFGYHQIGTSSNPQRVTLTNGGQAILTISSIAVNNSDFSQTNTCGGSLAAGASCSITLTFKPTQPVAESATLSVTDNASNSPQTLTVNGTGAVSAITVFPVNLNFGSVTVGQSNTLPVTLANAANTTMTIQKISPSRSVYSQTNNCGASLVAGASCTINVTFTPTAKDTVTGTLGMGLNGKPTTTRVTMTGTGK
jgi:hypothetical protein